ALAVLAAEVAEEVALLIEFHDRRRLLAARAGALVGRRPDRVERIGAVDDPHVIVRADADADRLAAIPAGLPGRPAHGIDFEARRLDGAVGLRGDALLEKRLPDGQRREQRDERASDNEMPFHVALRAGTTKTRRREELAKNSFLFFDPREKRSSCVLRVFAPSWSRCFHRRTHF